MKGFALFPLFVLAWSLSASSGPRVPAFMENIDEAFAASKKSGKPLLIDFYGIWCPPCQEMDETVFEGQAFLEKAKNFVLLKVDVDKEYSWKLKDKYAVGGYPTYLFLNPQGEEIHRVVGYREPKTFSKIMDVVLKAKGKGLAESCKSDDAQDIYRCAVICSERKEVECATKAYGSLLKKSKQLSESRRLEAETFMVRQEKNEDLKREGFVRLMTEHGSHPWAILWADEYQRLLDKKSPSPKGKKALEGVSKNLDKMLQSKDLAETGLTEADVLGLGGNLLSELGRNEEARKLWLRAADKLAELAGQLPKGSHARGFTMERIHYLEVGGKEAEALKLADEYRRKFPEEFTFHYQTAYLLYDTNQMNKALPVAQQAYQHSYGDNRIRSAVLLMKLYTTIPDKASAKKVYDEVKGNIKPSAQLNVRTHRYLLQLDQEYLKVVMAAQKKG